jgi:hypothetical protein
MQMTSTDSDTTTATKARAATPRKAAATRSAVKPAASKSSTSTQPASTVQHVQHLVERAVLAQVGAALVIRDGIVSAAKRTFGESRGGFEKLVSKAQELISSIS